VPNRRRKRQQQRPVRAEPAGRKLVDRADGLDTETSPRPLVGKRGIDESVEQHPGAFLQEGDDALLNQLSSRRGIQQGLSAGSDLQRRVLDQLADMLGGPDAAGLAQQMHVDSALGQLDLECYRKRALSGPINPFDCDQPPGAHEPKSDRKGIRIENVLPEVERHPHARAVLAPALGREGRASHAYLFHGPGGAGKRSAARAVAAELLAPGSTSENSARRRALSGAHPDLTWVTPSGAHEILVSDIDGPVVSAASKTPFESSRRVFVIERVDELGDEAANRMLKTLEEPASYVHLILLTDRLAEVLPTIRSRCQLVRFDARPAEEVASALAQSGVDREMALACARLSLGDGDRAEMLTSEDGQALRELAEAYARAAIAGTASRTAPWSPMLAAIRARGDATRTQLELRAAAELELFPRKERKRVETEWSERIRRARRRTETRTLDLALQVVALWYADLALLAWGAEDLVRHIDRIPQLKEDSGPAPDQLRRAVELVEDTRLRFQLNVSEELACEALAYRLERELST
jgi:DNA polymerase-3 subunit delta'